MAATKQELIDWLNTLDDNARIAIDDGGLTLVTLDASSYYEIGGIPEDLYKCNICEEVIIGDDAREHLRGHNPNVDTIPDPLKFFTRE